MLVQIFEEQVLKYSDKIAVQTNHAQMTYGQLNNSANQIARTMLEAKESVSSGVDHLGVALLFEQSIDMIEAMLGTLKAGLTYIPLDPSYPENRLGYMLEHSEAAYILTNQKNVPLAEKIVTQNALPIEILNIDQLDRTCVVPNPDLEVDVDGLAYILYTSGSTGNPKGVMQNQRNIWHFIKNYTHDLKITSADRMTLFSSFSHDAAVMDIYGGLLNGATLYPVDVKNQVNIDSIAEWLIKEKITIWHSVPTVYRYFIKSLSGQERFPDLRLIVLGGESVIKHDVERFQELFQNTTLINLYGQSESSYNSGQFIGSKDHFRKVTLGKSVSDTELLVITEQGEGALPLEEGEIIVDSEHVALGYWKDEARTKEVFIDHPSLGRLYRTGDLGQLLVKGDIQYTGRKDFQVKIRGYRVELGDVESQLLKHPKIEEGVVIAKDGVDHNKVLEAFYVSSTEVSERELADYLLDKLPDYMVPTYFHQLDQIPLTPNNKVDRKALIQMELQNKAEIEYVAPRTETEQTLSQLWSQILDKDQIGVRDHFFKNGGNSLLAVQMLSKIFKEFNVEVPLRTIFTKPTIEELATYIDQSSKSIYAAIPVIEKQDYYPVSSAQKRLYVLNQFENNSIFYNMPKVMYIEGDLHVERLEAAFGQLVQRHEALRTSFHTIQGEILQKVHEDVEFKVQMRQADDPEVSELVEEFVRPFDLSQAPLLRVELVQLPDRWLLMYDMHHIISDGYSMNILVNELIGLYQGLRLPELKIQYKDFASWQNELFQSQVIQDQERYWLETFAGELPLLDLPTDYPRPAVLKYAGDEVEFTLSQEMTGKLNRLTQKTNTTLFMVLLTAYTITLAKYTRQEEIIVGSPIAGRSHADLENILGIFINMLAFRNHPEAKKSCLAYLNEVKETTLKGFENQDYQFEMLVEKLNLKRNLNRNPIFDAMFVLQNMAGAVRGVGGTTPAPASTASPIQIQPYEFKNQVSKFDLSLYALEAEGEIHCKLEYSTNLFKRRTIERFAKHLIKTLETMLTNVEQSIGEMELISGEEKACLLTEFNQTAMELPKAQNICQLFEAQAEQTPDQIAVLFEDEETADITTLTYRELNQRANQLARHLRSKGVVPNDLVGLMVNRSCEMLVGIYAILKAGGAYLPIDPDYPEERIEYMLADCQTRLLLMHENLQEKGQFSQEQILIDDESLYTGDQTNLKLANSVEDLAYVIYTSGSTGKPKGVMIEHGSVLNLLSAFVEQIEYQPGETFVSLTTIAFDIFVIETLVPLAKGLKVVIGNKNQQYLPHKLDQLLHKYQAQFLQATPSRMKLFLSATEELTGLQQLTHLLIGGEAFPESLWNQLSHMSKTKIYNLYGPTETTVWSTLKELNPDGELTIGRPIANTQVYILDQALQPVPINVPGELYIAGAGLARGYLNRRDLTEERFVPHPFVEGARMYRTGDLAKWHDNGEISILGRTDHQVKIRGFRIELGEIEAQLIQLEGVQEAVVVAGEDEASNKYLAAYFMATTDLTAEMLRTELAKELPDYMLPSYFVQLDQMPLTPNGKINRKELPKPNLSTGLVREYVSPGNEMEEKLAQIWSEVLSVERVGVTDSFFELGGHSFKIIALISKVMESFGVQLSMKEFFIEPTVAGIAKYIQTHQDGTGSTGVIDEPYILFNLDQESKLFCFPPGVPFGLGYSSLAQELKEYTLYGFNFIDQAERISEYVQIITEAQPDGPLTLVAYSQGGYLAFEVAKALIQQGRTVSDLIFLDVQRQFNMYPTFAEKEEAALNMIKMLEETEIFRSLVQDEQVKEKIINKYITYLEFANEVPKTGIVSADLHLIKAWDWPEETDVADTRDQWRGATTGRFMTYDGSGYHGVMLDKEHASKNGEVIRQLLIAREQEQAEATLHCK